MSDKTIQVCDIEGCQKEAIRRFNSIMFKYMRASEPDWVIATLNDIDLCERHEANYRHNLPELNLKKDD